MKLSIIIPILPILWVQTHIRSVRGSNPCTATNYFNELGMCKSSILKAWSRKLEKGSPLLKVMNLAGVDEWRLNF